MVLTSKDGFILRKNMVLTSKDGWENGIKKAQEGGAEVSAADFEFKNWNPLEDYTAESYESR